MKRNLLQRLTGPVTVLCIRFTDAEHYATRLFVLERGGVPLRIVRQHAEPDAATLKKECSIRPVLISVSGYGIITKPSEDAAIVEKVTSDPERFAWSLSDETDTPGSISFVRREQVEPLGQRLAENGIPSVGIRYGPAAADPEQEAERQAETADGCGDGDAADEAGGEAVLCAPESGAQAEETTGADTDTTECETEAYSEESTYDAEEFCGEGNPQGYEA